jgi:2,4-dienoyl-CoA reductase-like NADH-dependent reductase (Old Yellow Enzyme family)
MTPRTLFGSVHLGSMVLKNRIVMAPMTRHWANARVSDRDEPEDTSFIADTVRA